MQFVGQKRLPGTTSTLRRGPFESEITIEVYQRHPCFLHSKTIVVSDDAALPLALSEALRRAVANGYLS